MSCLSFREFHALVDRADLTTAEAEARRWLGSPWECSGLSELQARAA